MIHSPAVHVPGGRYPAGYSVTLHPVNLKDPVRLHEKALDTTYSERFKDEELPESLISDVSRARISLRTGTQTKEFISRIATGIQLGEEQLGPVRPSQRIKEEVVVNSLWAVAGGEVEGVSAHLTLATETTTEQPMAKSASA